MGAAIKKQLENFFAVLDVPRYLLKDIKEAVVKIIVENLSFEKSETRFDPTPSTLEEGIKKIPLMFNLNEGTTDKIIRTIRETLEEQLKDENLKQRKSRKLKERKRELANTINSLEQIMEKLSAQANPEAGGMNQINQNPIFSISGSVASIDLAPSANILPSHIAEGVLELEEEKERRGAYKLEPKEFINDEFSYIDVSDEDMPLHRIHPEIFE